MNTFTFDSARMRWPFYFVLVAVLFLAFFLRVSELATYPPGLSSDEATSAIDAQQISHNGVYPLYEDFGRPEPLYQVLLAASAFFFGSTIFAMRLFSVFVGTLSVAAAYWAARECLYDLPRSTRQLAAFAAMGVLAVSLNHITLSRAIYRGIPQPLLMFLFIGSFVRGLRASGRQWLIISGVSLAALLYTYTAAFVVPFSLAAAGLSLLLFRRSSWREWLPKLIMIGAVCTILLIPLGLRFLDRPLTIIGRATDVGSGSVSSHVPSIFPRLLPGLTSQFFQNGDPNPQYNSDSAPLLPAVYNGIYLIGLAALLWRLHARSSALIAALLVLTIIPALASGEFPHGLRISGEFAVFPIIVAAGTALIITVLRSIVRHYRPILSRALPAVFCIGLLGLDFVLGGAIHQQYQAYFAQHLMADMYGVPTTIFEWFFRTDRMEFAQWLSTQHTPLLVPVDELGRTTTRAWLLTSYPNVTTADESFVVPPDARFVIPWSLELGGLLSDSRDYALLQNGSITLLPPLSDDSLRAVQSNLGNADSVNRSSGALLARIEPVSSVGVITFEQQHAAGIVFSNQARLNGWRGPDTLPSSAAATIPYTLDWSATRQIGDYDSSFVQIQTQDYQTISGDDELIQRWLYPSTLWTPSDHVPDTHILKIPANLAPGAYRLVAGLYVYVDRHLPATSADGTALTDFPTVGWIKVPQPREPEIPANSVTVNATFQGGVTLRALTVAPDAQMSSRIQLSLYWQADTKRPPMDATIFVHLTGANGQIVAQQDARPWNGQYPTFIWDKGEIVQTQYTLDMGTARPADLGLELGMYTFPGAVRLPVSQDGTVLKDSVVRFSSLANLVNVSLTF